MVKLSILYKRNVFATTRKRIKGVSTYVIDFCSIFWSVTGKKSEPLATLTWSFLIQIGYGWRRSFSTVVRVIRILTVVPGGSSFRRSGIWINFKINKNQMELQVDPSLWLSSRHHMAQRGGEILCRIHLQNAHAGTEKVVQILSSPEKHVWSHYYHCPRCWTNL
jgi:hypothetical protein